MDFKVVVTETFCGDLEEILEHVAANNPMAARNLGDRVIDRCEALSFFPERYPKVRRRPNIRRLVREILQSFLSDQAGTGWSRFSAYGMVGEARTRVSNDSRLPIGECSHDRRTILPQQAAALADDESLAQLRAAIYAERGRPEAEEAPAHKFLC